MSEKPYRPSNGTEGMIFEHNWCSKCWKDREGLKKGCPIIAAAMVRPVAEWVTDENGPRCKKFEAISNHVPKPRENKAQPKLPDI